MDGINGKRNSRRNTNDDGALEKIVLNYHAPGEGKTSLDAHFGTLQRQIKKRERMGFERNNVDDLLEE